MPATNATTSGRRDTRRRDPANGNPLLRRWSTPFGMPPFQRIAPEHFAPAFETALAKHRAETAAIAARLDRPTFANTIAALERSGWLLSRVADVFFNLASADTSDALQAIERDIAPKLADHDSAIHLDRKLFARIDDLYGRRDRLQLDDEERRVLERTHTRFVRAGARLDAKAKKRVAQINSRLAALVTEFTQNVLADEQGWHLVLRGERDLAGLPATVRSAAAHAAARLGHPGAHAITLARSSVVSFLQFSARRDLREQAYKAWVRRGEMAAKTDNRPLLREIVALRSELAKLLGYPTFADYVLDDSMAGSPEAARGLLRRVWPRAVKRAAEERQALQKLVNAEGANFKIAAWDWHYYAERERKARFDLDDAELRPYFALENMIRAAFDTATRLFGLEFVERPELPRYHEDVRVWEVRRKSGEPVGLFLGDYFARPSKQSGAWMSSYRCQHKLGRGQRPIIVNVMNFACGGADQPTLLSFDDARTLFHEFGHGLHGLLSNVTYPSIAGTNVARDFVELPSQLYEHWLTRPEVLKKFARHVETGRPIPDNLLARLKATETFNQGFATVEYTAAAIADLDLHQLSQGTALDCDRFEADTLEGLGMPQEIAMRHRLPHFLHVVSGYGAAYYSYLWSEVMDCDAFAAFEEAGNIFDRRVAGRLERYIYSAGNSRDPLAAYVAFRGGPPSIDGLMRKRGLA